MKKRNYLKVSYTQYGEKCSQDFTMGEVRLINTVLKDHTDNGKVEVELVECTEEEYKSIFG